MFHYSIQASFLKCETLYKNTYEIETFIIVSGSYFLSKEIQGSI